jgi:hypothetical protein
MENGLTEEKTRQHKQPVDVMAGGSLNDRTDWEGDV